MVLEETHVQEVVGLITSTRNSLGGHVHITLCGNCKVSHKKTENQQKETGDGQFFKIVRLCVDNFLHFSKLKEIPVRDSAAVAFSKMSLDDPGFSSPKDEKITLNRNLEDDFGSSRDYYYKTYLL